MLEFKVPARMLAAGLLALYDELALEYEAKKKASQKIPPEIAATLPVLLLRRQGNRQYFFAPGSYDPASFNKTREKCIKDERFELAKEFTYQPASKSSPLQLVASKRFSVIKAQMIDRILKLHPNWNLDLHALFPKYHPPPPTLPFERS